MLKDNRLDFKYTIDDEEYKTTITFSNTKIIDRLRQHGLKHTGEDAVNEVLSLVRSGAIETIARYKSNGKKFVRSIGPNNEPSVVKYKEDGRVKHLSWYDRNELVQHIAFQSNGDIDEGTKLVGPNKIKLDEDVVESTLTPRELDKLNKQFSRLGQNRVTRSEVENRDRKISLSALEMYAITRKHLQYFIEYDQLSELRANSGKVKIPALRRGAA